jgi:hypothetical protein
MFSYDRWRFSYLQVLREQLITNIDLAATEILALPQLRLRAAFNDELADKKLSMMVPETLSNAVVDLLLMRK